MKERNPLLYTRLSNWKFNSAMQYVEDESFQVKALVKALSEQFGNVGWFQGSMAIIIASALLSIEVDPEVM